MADARQEQRKAFRITSGRGFHITFQNGYTVSVQWGWGNYCENRNKPMPSLDDLRENRKSPEGEAGSMDAEVAVWHRDGGMLCLKGWDDTVKGWQTPADVLALLNWAASQPDAKPAALSHETDGGTKMPDRRLPLRIGGVMRCCIATLSEYEGLDGNGHEFNEGTVLPCKYCKSSLIIRAGAWEWNRSTTPPSPTPQEDAK